MEQQNYREARKKAGIKAEQAAVELGVSMSTLLNWERGDTAPNANNIRDMARLYGSTANYLIGME